MLNIVVVMALFAATSFGNALPRRGTARNGKIVNGRVDTIDNHPWQVSLGQFNNQEFIHWCGGTIISKNWVLTAAHCLLSENNERMEVTHVSVGSSSLTFFETVTLYEVDYTTCHKNFRFVGKVTKNDIALLHVSEPFEFDEFTHDIQLYRGLAENIHGQNVTVSGFGYVGNYTSPFLHSVELQTRSLDDCDEFLSRIFHDRLHRHGYICAYNIGNKAACSGDSGGPVTIKMSSDIYLVGVVAFGSRPCGKRYDAFTDVAFHYNWIDDEMRRYRRNGSTESVFEWTWKSY